MASTTNQTKSENTHLQAVSHLYDQTWSGARFSWLNEDNLAQHLGYWDDSTHTHAESLIKMNRVMADRIGIENGDRIFDAGCGYGGTSLWLAKEYEARVLGVTISADQVERANYYAKQKGLKELVNFEQKDFLNTDFADASFDVFWAQESVCHVGDRQGFLTEAYRLLKPGGWLIIEDCYLFDRPYSAAEKQMLESWFTDVLIPTLPTNNEFIHWAETVGFQDIELEDISSFVKPSYDRIGLTCRLMNPIVFIAKVFNLQADILQKYGRGMFIQQQTFKGNLWFVGICSARKPKK